MANTCGYCWQDDCPDNPDDDPRGCQGEHECMLQVDHEDAEHECDCGAVQTNE